MKQLLSILIPIALVIALVLNQVLPADAAKKEAKKKGVSQEVIDEMTLKVDNLTRKIYERELYSPDDTKELISLKLQLDEQMDILPEASFAPIYFKIANIYRMRNQKDEAIDCYKTILENFPDTAYGPKSRAVLEDMGVQINLPQDNTEDEEEEDSEEDF